MRVSYRNFFFRLMRSGSSAACAWRAMPEG